MIKEPLGLRIKAHLNFCRANKGKFKRVSESAWRFLFYLCIWLYVWIVTRLIYFPFFIIRPVLFDAPALIQADYRWENIQPPIVPRLFALMLLSLLILHIYWTIIIMKIALKSVKGNINDIREELDNEISSAVSSENIDAIVKNDTKRTKKIE
uniref:TLC domain-containing protein n=1 Tax=Wuchereria bancrofti TaxID=6293 RepID=A0A1I8EYL2_WUCBA